MWDFMARLPPNGIVATSSQPGTPIGGGGRNATLPDRPERRSAGVPRQTIRRPAGSRPRGGFNVRIASIPGLEKHLNCHVTRRLGLGQPDKLGCMRGLIMAGVATDQSDGGNSSGHHVGIARPENDLRRTRSPGLVVRTDGYGRSNGH
jgi:hypothetical protein